MTFSPPEPELAARLLRGRGDVAGLFGEARRLRDEGRGRTITYSRKVFVPLTTMCRDTCTYCTFAKPPGAGGQYLTPDDVLAVAVAGERRHCTEALFTLGDRPEDRWLQAAAFLASQGCTTTLEYLVSMTERVRAETALLPHVNPGIMGLSDIRALRPSSPSMGLMLENVSPRLMDRGMPHHGCPDKEPALRMATIAAAAEARVPFTTGVLVGIGETPEELVESLFALADAAAEGGHVQEVIVQNFRAKADTRKRRDPEPTVDYTARVVAVARWILGPAMNLQVPPNLTERFEVFLDAGVNDWGGVSPVTIDWVNPEAPWPHLEELRGRTEAGGFTLRARLPVYPEYLSEEWIDGGLWPSLTAAADDDGYARTPHMEGAV